MSIKYVPPHKRRTSNQQQQPRPQQQQNFNPNDSDEKKQSNTSSSYSNNYNNSIDSSSNHYNNRFSRPDYSNQATTKRNIALERKLFGDPNSTISQGINFKDYDSIKVQISGQNAPKPCHHFDKSDLCSILINNINLCKYNTPTPIQKYSIPCILQKRDLMACAQTGSGKTAAFLIPIIHNLYTTQNSINNNNIHRRNMCVYPSVVILSPTRELAMQIHVESSKFVYQTGLRTCVVYGGTNLNKQARDFRYGVDILVATPGRLNDFIQRGYIGMDYVKYNVLDEADNMLDMGFMPQIQQIIRQMPRKKYRQTLMFSATFPVDIQKLAADFLCDYIFVTVGVLGSTNKCIEQKLKFVLEYNKTKTLIDTINAMQKVSGCNKEERLPLTLIFVQRKKDTERVCHSLISAGYSAMAINGNKSQPEREYALKMFKTGMISFLVATDVASRGINIPNVLFVINYDLPNNIDAYVHRIGRTGRCGNDGNAISFVNEGNKSIIKGLMKLLKESKSDIPQWFADLYYKFSSRNSYNSYNRYNKKIGRDFGSRDVRTGNGYKKSIYNDTNNTDEQIKQTSKYNKYKNNISDSW